MKWTNIYNLPEPLAQAAMRDEHVRTGDWSISETCGPTQLAVLRRRYEDRIVRDVSDMLWIILGKGIHFVIEKFKGGKHQLLEHHMKWSVAIGKAAVTVSGTLDYFDTQKGAIHDWKVTGLYKVVKGTTADWAKQLNRYRLAAKKTGLPAANTLINQCIIRDWMKRDIVKQDYPKVPFVPIKQVAQPYKDIEEELVKDLIALENAKILDDESVALQFPCSQEDRWAKSDTFCVCKTEGRAVPKGVHYERQAALDMHAEKGKGYHVEHRPGMNTRCEDYCDVRPFCKQYESMPRKFERIAG